MSESLSTEPLTPSPFWLPQLEAGDSAESGPFHRGRTRAGAPFRCPRLDRRLAERVASEVRRAALEARRSRTIRDVAESISAAALSLCDPGTRSGASARELLTRELGWSAALVTETLERMVELWRFDALWRLIDSELGEPELLDGFRMKDGRWRCAQGPPLLLTVHAGNVPGVAVTALVRSLLARSGSLCKLPEEEPGLVPLFARTLAGIDPLLARGVAATWWPGSEPDDGGSAWVKSAGKVVVYGGDEAVEGIRGGLSPATDLLVYGPRLGVGFLLPDASLGRAAEGLAADVCAYDQQGCVSPRLVWVLGGARRLEEAAEALATALEREVARIPRPPLAASEAAELRGLRASAEFRGYVGPGSAGGDDAPESRLMVRGPEDLRWTVLLEEGPGIRIRALPRLVQLRPAADLDAAASELAALAGRIQAVGYAGRELAAALAEKAAELGASRVAPFGEVAWPPADWRHDGKQQLLPLVRWTDWEPPP